MKLKKFLPFIGIGTICLPMITSCSSSTLNSFINKLKKDEKSIVKAKKIKHSIKNNRYDSEYYNVYPFNNKNDLTSIKQIDVLLEELDLTNN